MAITLPKALEILELNIHPQDVLMPPDVSDAIKLGIEALKRIRNCRFHPGAPMYRPLPGENMPGREGAASSLL